MTAGHLRWKLSAGFYRAAPRSYVARDIDVCYYYYYYYCVVYGQLEIRLDLLLLLLLLVAVHIFETKRIFLNIHACEKNYRSNLYIFRHDHLKGVPCLIRRSHSVIADQL